MMMVLLNFRFVFVAPGGQKRMPLTFVTISENISTNSFHPALPAAKVRHVCARTHVVVHARWLASGSRGVSRVGYPLSDQRCGEGAGTRFRDPRTTSLTMPEEKISCAAYLPHGGDKISTLSRHRGRSQSPRCRCFCRRRCNSQDGLYLS